MVRNFNCNLRINNDNIFKYARDGNRVGCICILLDIIMPDMTGYDVAQALRRENALKLKPLIFLTALSEEEVSFHEGKLSDVIVLTKPIASQDLAACIDQKIKEAGVL